jgi:murein DD-endopeptidase MepM/ murein hydrolase activator NlpD
MKALPQNVEPFKGNPYQKKRTWYHPRKGHSGVDLKYKTGDILLSPITGVVVRVKGQKQMGKTIYVQHEGAGDIHVFAHNKAFLLGIGDTVVRDQKLVITGNSGSRTTAPHVHYEIITKKPINPEDKIMTRSLGGFKGYNTDPIPYLELLYKKHNIDFKTGKKKGVPLWLQARKIINRIPLWLRTKK